MKNIFKMFGIFTIIFLLSSCVNNFMGGDEGFVTINFGSSIANFSYNADSENRSAVWSPDGEMIAKMDFEVLFIQNGRTIQTHRSSSKSSISISIRSSTYTITVNAKYDGKPYATGKAV